MSELSRSMVDFEVLLGRSVKKLGSVLTWLNTQMLKCKSSILGDFSQILLR